MADWGSDEASVMWKHDHELWHDVYEWYISHRGGGHCDSNSLLTKQKGEGNGNGNKSGSTEW